MKKKYFTDEERKNAIREQKRKYIINKPWICEYCDNHNYTLSGIHCHLKTIKHKNNVQDYENKKNRNIVF